MHGRNSFSTSKSRHIQTMTKCENLKDKTFTRIYIFRNKQTCNRQYWVLILVSTKTCFSGKGSEDLFDLPSLPSGTVLQNQVLHILRELYISVQERNQKLL